ncbi:RUN domain-containing protein 3B-like isoform X2 [Paramacrobiotus metropolitanus]|uniref:RUN domain-containing protein 3B-like isoform X2 n=1 Tax=Paramacrobiotus metropolitanus TaxID=2943436 RepID=UPI0024457221|nr:RUN domain-containing protein 3B-like isoform X2 [Paramacrobiotus metropolitanus]
MATRRNLPQSEYAKQRKNLLRVCGMALKSVVDKYCFEGVLSDADTDVRNLLVILENILMHRCKSQGVKWFSEETPSFWPCVVALCSKMKRSCVPCIAEMGSSFSGLALGRIFLQMALMERRLSEYLGEMVASESRDAMLRTYEADAFMLKDEGAALPHMCLGLNAIDFSFCPKGEALTYPYVPCIDFAPYLDFTPCSQAVLDDEHEQAVLNGEIERTEICTDQQGPANEADWKTKYQKLYLKFKDLSHQKNYAEEMLNLKQERIEKLESELANYRVDLDTERISHQRDVGSLQEVVMELQTQMSLNEWEIP